MVAKPQIQVIRTLDLLDAFKYVSQKYYGDDTSTIRDAGYRDVWGYLMSANYVNNDSTTEIPFVTLLADNRMTGGELFTPAGVEYIQHMVDEFELTSIHARDIQWVISW